MILNLFLIYLLIGIFCFFVFRLWLIPLICRVKLKDNDFLEAITKDAQIFFDDPNFEKEEVKGMLEEFIPMINLKTVFYWILLWPFTLFRIFTGIGLK